MTTPREDENSASARRTDREARDSSTPPDPLDGTPYEGSEAIEQQAPPRWPGFTRRPLRVAEWTHLKGLEIKRRSPELTPAEVQEKAERALQELYESPHSEAILEQLEQTAPTSSSPRPSEHREEIEIAAVRWLAPIRWLIDRLMTRVGSRGPAPCRAMVVAVFVQMAFSRGRPTISAAHQKLEAGHPMLSWAHDYPKQGPGYTTLCGALDEMLHHHPARALVDVNLELIRRLAELRTDRGRPRHPDIGRFGVVDGMLLQADVQQRGTKKDRRLKSILHGPGRENVETVVYTSNGNITRACTGYKLMVIADMSTTLPLVWSMIPANGNEREETLRLLGLLFELWPECPMEALVGDSLYDHSVDFARELVFNLGVQPVFPTGSEYASGLPHQATKGIPVCACGEEMTYKDTDGNLFTAKKRARLGIPRGAPAPRRDGRLRWRCKNGRCRNASTRPIDDPRLYTYYHRGGDHRLAHLRAALLVRRNGIESIFASLKHLGVGGTDVNRPRWADDVEMDWLVSTALTFQTGRRLIHETGLYETAYEELDQLGLLQTPSVANPAPGPESALLRRVRDAREGELEPAAAPRSWVD